MLGTLNVLADAVGDSLPYTAKIDISTLAGVLGKRIGGSNPLAQVVVSLTGTHTHGTGSARISQTCA